MKVYIATTHVPFRFNPAEALAKDLRQAVLDAGHLGELVRIPFNGEPPGCTPDHLVALSLLAFGEGTDDLLIAMEYPAYLVPHPRKVLWLTNCGSEREPLSGGPDSERIRETAVVRRQAERRVGAAARGVYSISTTMSLRWRRRTGLDAAPLYPPPRHVERLEDPPEDFILVPVSTESPHRMEVVLDALARTRQPVVLRGIGSLGEAGARLALNRRAAALGLAGRWQWPEGNAGETTPYARCRAVLSVPVAETNPEVALLAMRAGKPLITGLDSGAPAELVAHRRTGWTAAAEPAVLAWVMDEAWSRPDWTRTLGRAARADYESMDLDWAKVLERLIGRES